MTTCWTAPSLMPIHGRIPIPDLTLELDRAVRRGAWSIASAHAVNVLAAIAAAPETVTAVAHPLGFVHVLLCKRDDGSRLRLHLWPGKPFAAQSPFWAVHRHSWPLTSLVVTGQIHDQRYALAEDPSGDRRVYVTTYEGDQSVLAATGRVVRVSPQLPRLGRAARSIGSRPTIFTPPAPSWRRRQSWSRARRRGIRRWCSATSTAPSGRI